MKIFIDSAKLNEIEEAYSYGIIDGITTNPSLIKQSVDEMQSKGEKIDIDQYLKQIINIAKKTPVSLEVTETDYEGMVKEARKLYSKFSKSTNTIYIKIPINSSLSDVPSFDALKAIKTLSKDKIAVNCTLIFTPEQALLAAKAGARVVSPFAGRIDDYIRTKNNIPYKKEDYFPAFGWKEGDKILDDNGIISGIELVRQCSEILKKYGYKTEVIAASLRNNRQVREAALAKADIVTIPFEVLKSMIHHPKTEEGMKKFTEDIVLDYAKLGK